MLQTSEVLKKLDLLGMDGCKLSSDTSVVLLENQREEKLTELKTKFRLEAVFEFQKQPLLLFFNNPPKEVEEELHKWIWNFNKTAAVVIIRESTIDIYNGFSFNQDKKLLDFLESNFKPDTNHKFNFTNILSGETWLSYKDKLSQKNRVDTKLLENLDAVRELIVEDFKSKDVDKNLALETANALIGRLLFVRYLIDRKVKIHFGHSSNGGYLTSVDLNTILESQTETYNLFDHLKDKSRYNGDMFPFTVLEKSDNYSVNLSHFVKLFSGEDIGKKQLSLFPYYDFSIIPVEFISNVYESFIGIENQRDQGAFYTPVFLVDYILNKTVKKYLRDSLTASCPVLDPACGSGIFLVETLRSLIEKYQELNPNFEQNTEGYHRDLIQLVKENIFGIDRDIKALHVAIFSIYITLLDNQNPADVEKFHFPPLLGSNFFEADFFKLDLKFNEILRGVEFRFVLGNPPWGNLSKNDATNKNYLEYCKHRGVSIGGKEIAQAFMVRVGDLVSPNTDIALIVTSKVLYNLQSVDFRQYFLKRFYLDHILELSSVRDQVFDKVVKGKKQAVAPASVLFYRKANELEETSSNLVLHIGIKPNVFFKNFKTLVIEKRDVQRVRQGLFLEYDWLFKVLVYGNILDFYLIKRLKDTNRYCTVASISEKYKIESAQGVIIGKKDKINDMHSDLIGVPFLDTQEGMLQKFYCIINEKYTWKEEKVTRERKRKVFDPPGLLIKSGINTDLGLTSAYNTDLVVFTDSITVFKSNIGNEGILKNLSAYLNSDFFRYYLLLLGSSAAKEREQIFDEEIHTFPFFESDDIVTLVTQIEQVKKEIHNPNTILTLDLQIQEEALIRKLNEDILETYNLNQEEKALVNYALNVSIPIWKNFGQSNAILKITENQAKEELSQYAQVFYNFFKPRFSNNFGVEVYHANSSIAVRFFHTDERVETPISFYFNQENHIFNHIFKAISLEKVSQDLFIQKDIRGFDKNSFYIIKPNERKCWHPAVAYLDAYEFGETLDESKNSLQ